MRVFGEWCRPRAFEVLATGRCRVRRRPGGRLHRTSRGSSRWPPVIRPRTGRCDRRPGATIPGSAARRGWVPGGAAGRAAGVAGLPVDPDRAA